MWDGWLQLQLRNRSKSARERVYALLARILSLTSKAVFVIVVRADHGESHGAEPLQRAVFAGVIAVSGVTVSVSDTDSVLSV